MAFSFVRTVALPAIRRACMGCGEGNTGSGAHPCHPFGLSARDRGSASLHGDDEGGARMNRSLKGTLGGSRARSDRSAPITLGAAMGTR